MSLFLFILNSRSHKKKAEEEEEGSVQGTSRKNERESPEKGKGGHTGVPPAR